MSHPIARILSIIDQLDQSALDNLPEQYVVTDGLPQHSYESLLDRLVLFRRPTNMRPPEGWIQHTGWTRLAGARLFSTELINPIHNRHMTLFTVDGNWICARIVPRPLILRPIPIPIPAQSRPTERTPLQNFFPIGRKAFVLWKKMQIRQN
jgi:hypothetical protein